MVNFLDFIFHFDRFLTIWIQNYGPVVYVLLFLMIFVETGLVIMPFLPGDSLLFIAGTFASQHVLSVWILFASLSVAAILGDSLNYWIGKVFGEKIFLKKKLIKKRHLDKTHEFFRKHGGKTIVFARFIPIIRSIAPFVAGVGKMRYRKFFAYNFLGAVLWVGIFVFAGYFFGNIPFVENNLSWFIIAIILVSILPITIRYVLKKN